MPISLAFNGFIIVSIRTPRAGRDEQHEQSRIKRLWFLSARPGRGATSGVTLAAKSIKVSIRTPRAGRDVFIETVLIITTLVSIRTPRAGRDGGFQYILLGLSQFLSARPGRGATWHYQLIDGHQQCFYPHAPGGARRRALAVC